MRPFLLFLALCLGVASAHGQINDAKDAERKMRDIENYLKRSKEEQDSISKEIKALEKKLHKYKTDSAKINRNKGTKTNTYMIVYDFATKTYDTNFVRPRIHHPVVFKIKNINRMAYQVMISSKDSVLAVSDFPEHFELKNPEKDNSAIEPLSEKKDAITQKFSDGDVVKGAPGKNNNQPENETLRDLNHLGSNLTLEDKKRELQEGLWQLKNQILHLENSQRLGQALVDSLGLEKTEASKRKDTSSSLAIGNKIEGFEFERKKKADTLARLQQKLAQDSASFRLMEAQLKTDTIKTEAIKAYGEKLAGLRFSYTHVVNSYRKVWEVLRAGSKLSSIASLPLLCPADFVSACKDSSLLLNDKTIAGYWTYVSSFYQKVSDFNNHLDVVTHDYDIIRILTNEGIKKLQAPVNALKASVDKMSEMVKSRRPNEALENIVHVYKTLSNQAAYEMISAPIQPSKDLVVFDAAIRYKKKGEYVEDSRTFSYREFVRGGLRYDFSTGLILSFGVNDYTYQTAPANGDSVTIVRKESGNLFLPSIAAMFHASIRTWRQTSLAFTLGASINTSELDINSLFPGLSLMIGKSEKFIFTIGPALKKINYLKSRYDVGKSYLNGLKDDELMSPAFRVGGFVGISYNLTNKQKSNFKVVKD